MVWVIGWRAEVEHHQCVPRKGVLRERKKVDSHIVGRIPEEKRRVVHLPKGLREEGSWVWPESEEVEKEELSISPSYLP